VADPIVFDVDQRPVLMRVLAATMLSLAPVQTTVA
jgi:hypothetical protein